MKNMKIVLPVDYYSTEKGEIEKSIVDLLTLFPNQKIDLDLVFVYSKEFVGIVKIIFLEQWDKACQKVKDNFSKYVETLSLPKNKNLTVNAKTLPSMTESTRSQSHAFLNYCAEYKYDFIYLKTEGKQGLQRVLDGSFVEKIVKNGTTPVISTNKYTKIAPWDKALIPFEVNDQYSNFLGSFLKSSFFNLCKRYVLFHSISQKDFKNLQWAVSKYNKEGYDYSGMVDRAEKELLNFFKEIKEKSELNEDISLKYKKKKESIFLEIINQIRSLESDVLILALNLRPKHIPFLGSTTTSLIRNSPVPIIIFPRNCNNEF